MITKNRAVLELIIAGSLWGFGFVATLWGLQTFSPIQFLLMRFLLAWLFGELFYCFFFSKGKKIRWLYEFKLGLPAGLLLGSVILFQTIGLKTTTATQSGFITTLYVILVPLFQHLFFKKKQPLQVFLYAGLALFGTFLLTGADFHGLKSGDLWTLGCSIIAAFHIIYISRIAHKTGSSFQLNNTQSMISFFMIFSLWLNEDVHFSTAQFLPMGTLPMFGLLMTVFGSTLIGFTIQMRTQKVLSPSTASMLFLLESPFALLFGFLFLKERLSFLQNIGAAIILISSFLTIQSEPAPNLSEAKDQ